MLQKAMQFHVFLCAVSIVQASESEEKSCDKNLMAMKNTAVFEGRQSLEEVTLQDQEKNGRALECINSSFSDVEHVRTDLNFGNKLEPPDVDPNWKVTEEIECSDLMRRNTKAAAYQYHKSWRGGGSCQLFSKALRKRYPHHYYKGGGCVGYKTFKSLCAAVSATPGVKSVPTTTSDPQKFHYVISTDASRKTRKMTEKNCADQLLEIREAAKVAQKNLDHITHYEFRPQTNNGENNCFLGRLGKTFTEHVEVDFGQAKECLGRVA